MMTIMTSHYADILHLVSKERKWYYNNYIYGSQTRYQSDDRQVGESEDDMSAYRYSWLTELLKKSAFIYVDRRCIPSASTRLIDAVFRVSISAVTTLTL